ncbi:hypothetical protein SNEBB_009636 [Seison nebaliae]|nr:hypothetical protein SNEBB_009636 [Seison nebaliae]
MFRICALFLLILVNNGLMASKKKSYISTEVMRVSGDRQIYTTIVKYPKVFAFFYTSKDCPKCDALAPKFQSIGDRFIEEKQGFTQSIFADILNSTYIALAHRIKKLPALIVFRHNYECERLTTKEFEQRDEEQIYQFLMESKNSKTLVNCYYGTWRKFTYNSQTKLHYQSYILSLIIIGGYFLNRICITFYPFLRKHNRVVAYFYDPKDKFSNTFLPTLYSLTKHFSSTQTFFSMIDVSTSDYVRESHRHDEIPRLTFFYKQWECDTFLLNNTVQVVDLKRKLKVALKRNDFHRCTIGKFYYSECSHCQLFGPKFHKVVQKAIDDKLNVSFARTDILSIQTHMFYNHRVHTVPTLISFMDGRECDAVEIMDAWDVDKIYGYVKNMTRRTQSHDCRSGFWLHFENPYSVFKRNGANYINGNHLLMIGSIIFLLKYLIQ